MRGFCITSPPLPKLSAAALQGLALCSSMLNEGVKLEADCGDALRIGFEYAGVSRQLGSPSDRSMDHGDHSLLAGNLPAATFNRPSCRSFTGAFLNPPRLDSYFGCHTIEFGADSDQMSFASDAARLPIVNADRYLNQARHRILPRCSFAPQGAVEPHSSRRGERHHDAVAERPGAHRKRRAPAQPQSANAAAQARPPKASLSPAF